MKLILMLVATVSANEIGIKIKKECAQELPYKNIKKLFSFSMQKGTMCLNKLKGPSAKHHYNFFNNLKKNKQNIGLECAPWGGKHQKTVAVASRDHEEGHPQIYLNAPLVAEMVHTSPYEIKRTFFHEVFHLMGHRHGEGTEYAYTCEVCCFPGKVSEETKKLACNICSGKLNQKSGIKYDSKLAAFFIQTQRYRMASEHLQQRQYSAPDRNEFSLELVEAFINMKSRAMGLLLGNHLLEEKKLSIPLSKVQRKWLKSLIAKTKKNISVHEFKLIDKQKRVIEPLFQAHVELLKKEGSTEKAGRLLLKSLRRSYSTQSLHPSVRSLTRYTHGDIKAFQRDLTREIVRLLESSRNTPNSFRSTGRIPASSQRLRQTLLDYLQY